MQSKSDGEGPPGLACHRLPLTSVRVTAAHPRLGETVAARSAGVRVILSVDSGIGGFGGRIRLVTSAVAPS